MNTAKSTAAPIESRTYIAVHASTACREFEASHITYKDTIFADGRIVSRVSGISPDGERFDTTEERRIETPVDFERIHAYRTTHGWRFVRGLV